MKQICRWHLYTDADELQSNAVQAILQAAAKAIAARGRFFIVLAGGDTPRGIYARLAAASADWKRWEIYFGDERCLPAADASRNDHMARSVWLDRVPIPSGNVHAIAAESGADEAARRYAELLMPVDRFDVVLLGLGEDGHTASLFPGQPTETDLAVVPIHGAPKPPPERVSLTAGRLSRANQVMFIVAGRAKQSAIARWRRGERIPAAAISPPNGVDILVDLDAWPD